MQLFSNIFGALGHRKAGKKKEREGKRYRETMNYLGDNYWSQFAGTKDMSDWFKYQQKFYGHDSPDNAGGIKETYDPWIEGGEEGQNALVESIMGNAAGFKESPGYKFAMEEGERAINRNALASGVHGGNRSRALVEHATGTADQEFQKYLSNLNALSTTGLNALNNRNALWETFASGLATVRAGGAAGKMEASFAAADHLQAGMQMGGAAIDSGIKMAMSGISGGMGGGGMQGVASSFQ